MSQCSFLDERCLACQKSLLNAEQSQQSNTCCQQSKPILRPDASSSGTNSCYLALLRAAVNASLVSLYYTCLGCRGRDGGACIGFASYVFLWATTLWLNSLELVPPCLKINSNYRLIYEFIAIPVTTSIVYKTFWIEMMEFLTTMEYMLHDMVTPINEPLDYQSIFDPSLGFSFADLMAIMSLIWVGYSIKYGSCLPSCFKSNTCRSLPSAPGQTPLVLSEPDSPPCEDVLAEDEYECPCCSI